MCSEETKNVLQRKGLMDTSLTHGPSNAPSKINQKSTKILEIQIFYNPQISLTQM